MSKLIHNTFTKYEFTEHELHMAAILHEEQMRWIQSQIADFAEAIVALEVDPNNYTAFVQQEAELRGSMNALKYLIDCHTAALAYQIGKQDDSDQ